MHRSRLPAAERRRQIVEVTTRLIAERGFWGLSMQDVADGCGVTVPGLLHHVGSKDGLLLAVLDHRDEADMQWVLAQAPGGLRETCAAVVRRNAGQPEIVRLFAVLEAESLTPDHPAHDYFRARQERTVETFSVLCGDAVLARQVVALMDGLQLQWLRFPSLDLVAEWEAGADRLFGPLTSGRE
ncbi:TetR/AcrR family transcriptional regulator [Actinoplanes bogorensis]|uniref:TetR/AcrR family transcriptional regulator n=1 Tax=Paractinoplanes bogorensis TaxID=1610840 RepID=A0ABS5YNY6_9ACTN|nr:TetR/AcrR family transcriptional regulator [Actinoplanes bogorensis]MBU2665172.1 TetR/AcrR family transcriptional regulator [Actinoplanes bogorensis]